MVFFLFCPSSLFSDSFDQFMPRFGGMLFGFCQIPTPVYWRVPRLHTQRPTRAKAAHHARQIAIPTTHSRGETRPRRVSTGNANKYRNGSASRIRRPESGKSASGMYRPPRSDETNRCIAIRLQTLSAQNATSWIGKTIRNWSRLAAAIETSAMTNPATVRSGGNPTTKGSHDAKTITWITDGPSAPSCCTYFTTPYGAG